MKITFKLLSVFFYPNRLIAQKTTRFLCDILLIISTGSDGVVFYINWLFSVKYYKEKTYSDW